MGVIERFEYFGFEGEPRSVVDHVLAKTVRAQGRDPKALCEAMDRIFPLDKRKGVNMDWKDTEQDLAQIYDLHKIQGVLEEYRSFLDAEVGHEASVKRLEIVKKITAVLNLNKRGSYAKESRLDMAAGEAGWFLREYGKAMEGISQVSCKICGRRSVFRMTVWEEPKPDAAQVYRIPGLLYDDKCRRVLGSWSKRTGFWAKRCMQRLPVRVAGWRRLSLAQQGYKSVSGIYLKRKPS